MVWRFRTRASTTLLAVLVGVSTACGPTADLPDTDGPVIPAVGAVDTKCGPTVLPGDVGSIRSDSECFLAEMDGGRATVWDVVSVGTDGEVTIRRFDFDGNVVWITIDSPRSGSGERNVVVSRCEAIDPIEDDLPQGLDCSESAGEPLDIVDGLVPSG